MKNLKNECPNCKQPFKKCDCKWKQIRAILNERKHVKGTTLIELLVVIAIMAIIAGISVPSYYAISRGNKLRTAARQMTIGLQ